MEDPKLVILLALAIMLTLASIATLNVALIAAGMAAVVMAALFYRLWYVIEALVFRHTNMIELFGGYEMSGTREVAIRKRGDAYSATAAALLATNARKGIDAAQVESIIQQTSTPFKFVLQAERLSAKKLIDALQTKISMKRLEAARFTASSDKSNAMKAEVLKKEIAELEKEVAVLSASTPMRLCHYIMTSALSENSFSAAERAILQIRALSNMLGAVLGAEPVLLSGSDLAAVLELDSTLVE
jgi:hypothetical protein